MAQLGMARVIIFAKDIDKMVSFYENVLGLRRVETADDSRDFVSLDAGGAQVALHRIPEKYAGSIEIADPPVAREGTPIKIAFRVDDVREARLELASRGGILGPVQETGALHLCDGLDPEGNVYQLSNRS